MPARIRTGVIGVGALGKHHARWLSQIEQSELIGIFDQDHARAVAHASQLNCKAFDSVEKLLDAVDAVSIAATTSAHFDLAVACLERGKHCLIEKPVTATMDQARELEKRASKSKVVIMVGQIERFNPAVRALDQFPIQPSFVEAHRLASFDPRGTDVAVILDLMIHDIDLVLTLIKHPVADIQSAAVGVISSTPDICNARLTFANGSVANLTSSRISLVAMRKMRLFQPEGYVALDLAKREADIYRLIPEGSPEEGFRIPMGKSGREILYTKIGDSGGDMLGTELTTFLRVVQGEIPNPIPLADGSRALEVALEVERIGRAAAKRVIGSESITDLTAAS